MSVSFHQMQWLPIGNLQSPCLTSDVFLFLPWHQHISLQRLHSKEGCEPVFIGSVII